MDEPTLIRADDIPALLAIEVGRRRTRRTPWQPVTARDCDPDEVDWSALAREHGYETARAQAAVNIVRSRGGWYDDDLQHGLVDQQFVDGWEHAVTVLLYDLSQAGEHVVTAPDPRPARDIARLLASLDGRSEPDDTDRAAAEEFVAALEAKGWQIVRADDYAAALALTMSRYSSARAAVSRREDPQT
jgi:hypothetical protein